jgi:hypothetical protein
MRKLLNCLLLVAAITVGAALPTEALAVSPDSTDAREIMEAVEAREGFNNSMFRLGITITDSGGRERTRQVQVRTMKFDGGSSQLVLFESPADLRNTGLLSIDYDDGSKDDDQWLYLPSVGRTTRIASADKSGSFMGTDLTYADMTRKDPGAYDYRIVEQSADVDGEECWLIEATPKTEKEQSETGYAKTQVWVSKTRLMPLQVKAWVIDGKRFKYTKLGDIRQVEGEWVAHQVTVRTVRNGEVESASTLVTSEMAVNSDQVTEQDFTEQRLERGL